MISDDFISIICRIFGVKITLVTEEISREIGDDNKEHYYLFYKNHHYQPMLTRNEVIERKDWITLNKVKQEKLKKKVHSEDEFITKKLEKTLSLNEMTPIHDSNKNSGNTSKNVSSPFTSLLEKLEKSKELSEVRQQREENEKNTFNDNKKYIDFYHAIHSGFVIV